MEDGSDKIEIKHLPPHTHTFTGDKISGSVSARPYSSDTGCVYGASGCFKVSNEGGTTVNNRFSRSAYTGLKSNLLSFNATPSGTISETGDNETFLPPYYTVYAWKRES